MKFPISMLHDFVTTSLTAEEVGDLLTMAGFELEGIEEVEGESVLDIKVCSNRGDGLSVFGLAREVLAKDSDAKPTDLYGLAASRFAGKRVASGPDCVTIETPDCSRYAAMQFASVTNGDAPEWMQKRLRQAGLRAISLIVDATNYVMLELGQPMHAFDLDKLSGERIVVRQARSGEKLTTLNGDEHELRPDQMMICDAERPVAVAGVMGGQDSEVSASTRRVLLESAHFLNTSVRRTRKQMGLNTDASYRFERSVDPEGVAAAMHRFAELIGFEASSLTDVYATRPTPKTLTLRMSRVVRLLGMEVTAEGAAGYLRRLGMTVEGDGEPFTVEAPTWRSDLEREDDLVEEIGRVHGYDRIPEALPRGEATLGGSWGREDAIDRAREAMVRAGFVQAMSHSLRGEHPLDAAGERIGPRHLLDPDMRWLRNALLPCLADAAARNRTEGLRLFEVGRVFAGVDKGYEERRQLAFLAYGPPEAASYEVKEPVRVTFGSAKAWMTDLLQSLGVSLNVSDGHDARFHPTRHAAVEGGVFGQIHPDVADELGLPRDTFLGEVDLDALPLSDREFKLSAISRNPAVRRDIAILIPKSVAYAQIEQAISSAAGELLERQWLFDVYAGKGIPEGSHSLAIGLQLRKHGANFTDEEANQVRDAVVAGLAGLGASQR